MKAGQEQEREEETSALPWSQLEGRRVGTSPALNGSEGPLRAGKHGSMMFEDCIPSVGIQNLAKIDSSSS